MDTSDTNYKDISSNVNSNIHPRDSKRNHLTKYTIIVNQEGCILLILGGFGSVDPEK